MSSPSDPPAPIEPEDAEDRDATEAPRSTERSPWMRRLAPLFLLVGGGLAAGIFLRQVPKEHEIELRLEDAVTVRRLDLTWTDAQSSRLGADAPPLQGSSWQFAAGAAPASVRTTVRLPDGAYTLEIAVDRTLGRTDARRTVVLGDADRIRLPVP